MSRYSPYLVVQKNRVGVEVDLVALGLDQQMFSISGLLVVFVAYQVCEIELNQMGRVGRNMSAILHEELSVSFW